MIGERGGKGLESAGWTTRQTALAELARVIPRLQSFLLKGPRKASGVEAQS